MLIDYNYVHFNDRYSVSLSKSALRKAANDFDGGHRYKRLLSISAATVNDVDVNIRSNGFGASKSKIAQRRSTGWDNRNEIDIERFQTNYNLQSYESSPSMIDSTEGLYLCNIIV